MVQSVKIRLMVSLTISLPLVKNNDEEKLIVERDGFKGILFYFILLIFFYERINYYEMIL